MKNYRGTPKFQHVNFKISRVGLLSPPHNAQFGCDPKGHDHGMHHSPLNYCVSVVKEEAFAAKVVCAYEMYQTKPKTQKCIFEAQIYSFLFQPSV